MKCHVNVQDEKYDLHDHGVRSLDEAVDFFKSYDWPGTVQRAKDMAAKKEDWCPPSFFMEPAEKIGDTRLHFFFSQPTSDSFDCLWVTGKVIEEPRSFLGVFKWTAKIEEAHFKDIPIDQAENKIREFVAEVQEYAHKGTP